MLDREEIQKSLKDNKPISATYETFDGLMLTLNAYETAGQDHYMTLDVAQSSSPTEKVVKKVEELKPRFKRWAYIISRSVYEDLDKDNEQFPGYDMGKEYKPEEENKEE